MGIEDAILIRTSNTLKYCDNKVLMLDRRKYPEEEVWQAYSTYEEVAQAIEDMVIQGAGSIGFAACFGLGLAAYTFNSLPDPDFSPVSYTHLDVYKRQVVEVLHCYRTQRINFQTLVASFGLVVIYSCFYHSIQPIKILSLIHI